MRLVFKTIKIFSTLFLHFGSVIGPIEMEPKQMETQYIKNLSNWKPDTQYYCYSDIMPILIMKLMTEASKNLKSTTTQ